MLIALSSIFDIRTLICIFRKYISKHRELIKETFRLCYNFLLIVFLSFPNNSSTNKSHTYHPKCIFYLGNSDLISFSFLFFFSNFLSFYNFFLILLDHFMTFSFCSFWCYWFLLVYLLSLCHFLFLFLSFSSHTISHQCTYLCVNMFFFLFKW